jgi:hypothetical protein
MKRRKLTGRDKFYVLRTATAALLIAVATLAGGCGGEEQATGSSEGEVAEQDGAEQKPAEPTEAVQETGEESAASIGEPVTVGDVEWTVTDAEQLDELISNRGDYEEGDFVSIDITLTNNTNQDITLATPFFTLIDDQGREVEPNIDNNFTFLYPEENMFVDQINPGATKEGKIIFPANPDASGFKLQVGEVRFASEETEYIDLGF